MKTAGRRLTKKDIQEIEEAKIIWQHGRRKAYITKAITALKSVGMDKEREYLPMRNFWANQ